MPNSPFIHPNAIVEKGAIIGANTRVWAFAHILPGAIIGEDCNLCDHVFVENQVIIGNRVTIKCGVQLWDGIRIENDVFIGPNATFTNDPFPRSKQHLKEYPKTVISKGASIGANATILPGIVIGMNAMVGAGSVVTHDVPPNAIVIGNPARITGYVNAFQNKPSSQVAETEDHYTSIVPDIKVIRLPLIDDLRGKLTVAEISKELPFLPKRYFIVFDVPSKEIRGEHAHKTLHQFMVCITGSISVVVDDGKNREEIILDRPNIGIYVPPMIWTIQYKYTSEAHLLVLASDPYNPDDYIRDYSEYLMLVNQ